MKCSVFCIALLGMYLSVGSTVARGADENPFRPPAVPLVACDPYFSIWSQADKLTDVPTRHWTGRPHRLTSLIRIDGKVFRLMGDEPAAISALPQTSVKVLPTRSIYEFAGSGVGVTLTFMTAALPDDLEVLSRPVTYLNWEVRSTNDQSHNVAVYFDSTAEAAVFQTSQPVVWSRANVDGMAVMRAGTAEQPILQKKGDDMRIDWGHLYVAAPEGQKPLTAIASAVNNRKEFAADGSVAANDDKGGPLAVNKDAPVMAVAYQMGAVTAQPQTKWLILAYDDEYSIQYFKRNLRPFWRRNGADASDLLKVSAAQYDNLRKECETFDSEFMADLTRAGGEKYAQIGALAFRQCYAGNKIAADANGQPLIFPKENTSNGCIGTVDVIYPMAPQFLLFGPSLSKGMLVYVMDYAASPRWKFPFAPHDLGTYPLANGQIYGGGERTEEDQMPVEETGNIIILLAAVAKMEGNADFAGKYWPTIQKWAEYLKAKGFDPENQLCTDDFAGHLAHNVNLSAKAIVALGAYAMLCDMHGDKAAATEYRALAAEYAKKWVKEADDGDHFRLTFDKPGSWSQKYNLVWDKILGLNLFPEEVLKKEMAFYKKKMNRYGLPLDSRKTYAKTDWSLWTASLTNNREDFEAMMFPVYDFLNEAPSRVALNDWYWTESAKETGFHARPVVGGVFLRLLYDDGVWKKWASRDKTKAANWAAIPEAPKIASRIAAADREPAEWQYTISKPEDGWNGIQFDDSSWKKGRSGFGTRGTPGAVVNTEWKTADIWLRREFDLAGPLGNNLNLWIHHDEDAEVYINGVLALTVSGWSSEYEAMPLSAAGLAALKEGKNTLAVHCHQTTGGQYIDVGFVEVGQK